MKIMKFMKKNRSMAGQFPDFMNFMPHGESALGSWQIRRDQEV